MNTPSSMPLATGRIGHTLVLGLLVVAALVIPSFLAVRPAAAKPLQVVTTTEDLAAIAREVAGDRAQVKSLARGYQDPHFVDAKPSLMVSLRKADLFVEVGRDLEVGWAPGLLAGARNPRIRQGGPGFVDASAQVQVLEVPVAVDRSRGDVHPFGNPHYWLDPANATPMARAIRDGLARVSPADAALFRQRCGDFERRLTEAQGRWQERAKSLGLTGMKVVTYHRSWSYFARAFGLEVIDFVEPRPGIPPSPNHVQDLVKQMKQSRVRLLIMEPFFDTRLPERISRDTGVPLVVMPTSVGAEENIRTTFDLFDRQLALIAQALKAAKP